MTHDYKAALDTFDRAEVHEANTALAIAMAYSAHRESIRAALELADRMQWQPIETAPKDDTEVLLYWPYWNKHRAITGSYSPSLKEFKSEWCLSSNQEQPTHWMPLPTPQKENER